MARRKVNSRPPDDSLFITIAIIAGFFVVMFVFSQIAAFFRGLWESFGPWPFIVCGAAVIVIFVMWFSAVTAEAKHERELQAAREWMAARDVEKLRAENERARQTSSSPRDRFSNKPFQDATPPPPHRSNKPVQDACSRHSTPTSVPDELRGIEEQGPYRVKTNYQAVDFILGLLSEVEWHRLEQVVADYFRLIGYEAKLTVFGADGGVDVELRKGGLVGLVQVKAWCGLVGVAPVRELFGELARRKAHHAYFFTTSAFSADAMGFARSAGCYTLVDGNEMVRRFNLLVDDKKVRLHKLAFSGDYDIPTCPQCGWKLVLRDGAKGQFWGCAKFPRCRGKLPVRKNYAA
ncbi:restriction endonuclease [Termitidicoccus mucosus]|uniref:restriction endonuclease n=1 Tax=Termitidicoccus mucosus TaxID=1184151 RepID=UPI0009FD5ADA